MLQNWRQVWISVQECGECLCGPRHVTATRLQADANYKCVNCFSIGSGKKLILPILSENSYNGTRLQLA